MGQVFLTYGLQDEKQAAVLRRGDDLAGRPVGSGPPVRRAGPAADGIRARALGADRHGCGRFRAARADRRLRRHHQNPRAAAVERADLHLARDGDLRELALDHVTSAADLLTALQPMSVSPLIARQIPIWDGEKIAGFVDLALEYAFKYRAGKESERIEIPAELHDREVDR